MSLFCPTDPDDQHDVLASNLLFATLLLSAVRVAGPLLEDWFAPYRPYQPLPARHWWLSAGAVLLLLSVRVGLYYAIRHGHLAAKLLVALGYVLLFLFGTHWQYGLVAGVPVIPFTFYSLLAVVNSLLTLAALGLMFTKPRVASRRILE